MREGRTAYELFIVAEGELEVTRDGQHIADIGPGGVAGELAVLNHVTRNSTVTTKTDVSLIHIDGREFRTLLEQVPEIAVKLLPIVAARASANADHTQ
jgi:CRP-like cAMP-binding protein